MRARSATPAVVVAALITAGQVSPSRAQHPLGRTSRAIDASTTPPQRLAPSPGQAPAVQPLNAKVTETLMGPTLAGPGVAARLVMSEDGDHLAVVTAKGSRQVVLVDGVEGPVFDEIPLNFAWSSHRGSGPPMVFSPTGGRSAYVARRAGDFIAVVDGKEATTLMTAATQGGRSGNPAGWGFKFNHDGSRLAYAAHATAGAWVMVVDGVPSPPYHAIDLRQVLLNGKRLVYVAQTADQQWHAVVDGKPGPGYVGIQSLQLTPDGAHYAYLAFPIGSQRAVAVVDGVVEGQSYQGLADLEQAPDGRVAYVVAKTVAPGAAHGGGTGALIVAGKEQVGSCGNGTSPMCLSFGNRRPDGVTPERRVAWSPDGKGFAYVQSNAPNPGMTVIVNGKPMGPSFGNATELSWSPDGSRFAYLETSPNGFFQVIDGVEIEAANDVPEFQWSPDGKRYAFVGKQGVVVDGKEQPKGKGYRRESLRWSPDSKHFVYGSQVTVGDHSPVVDGEVKPVYLGQFMAATQVRPPITFPSFSFSGDGSRLAYVARRYDATGRANTNDLVFVDAASYQGGMGSYSFPAFSPDGRHFATLIRTAQGSVVMIDGKVGPPYESMVLDLVSAVRFVGPNRYRFFGIKGGQIYRVTLDIS